VIHKAFKSLSTVSYRTYEISAGNGICYILVESSTMDMILVITVCLYLVKKQLILPEGFDYYGDYFEILL
jgi:hypothetical protein